jgi:hypothetical protein
VVFVLNIGGIFSTTAARPPQCFECRHMVRTQQIRLLGPPRASDHMTDVDFSPYECPGKLPSFLTCLLTVILERIAHHYNASSIIGGVPRISAFFSLEGYYSPYVEVMYTALVPSLYAKQSRVTIHEGTRYNPSDHPGSTQVKALRSSI